MPDSPYLLFFQWFEHAVKSDIYEPQTMTLSTVDATGQPDARVLIVKDVDEQDWYFASSSLSINGVQLEEMPSAALTFYWSKLGLQIRIRGKVCRLNPEQSADDFLYRGVVAREITLLGKQSQILESYESLDNTIEESLQLLEAQPSTIYPYWTLYCLQPSEIEFWQAHASRKHIRAFYSYEDNKWSTQLLWP